MNDEVSIPSKPEVAWPQVVTATTEHGKEEKPAVELEAFRNVYALGDCCALVDNPLPPLAQVRSWRLNFCSVNNHPVLASLLLGLGYSSCVRVTSARI